jgi:hypothetical protein
MMSVRGRLTTPNFLSDDVATTARVCRPPYRCGVGRLTISVGMAPALCARLRGYGGSLLGGAGVPERPSAANRAALSRREGADYGDTLFNPFFSEGSSLAAPVPPARKSSVKGSSKASL